MVEITELWYGRQLRINGHLGFVKSVRNEMVGIYLPYQCKTIYLNIGDIKNEYLK
jgi:hypothetical protein